MLEELMNNLEADMQKVIDSLKREYATIRAGRANPALLEKVTVEYYGVPTPINQMANISARQGY